MANIKIPKLRVMFDTNVLFTQVASDLVRQAVKTLVLENSEHTDLEIEWLLPSVVIGERKYQMLKKANELLPSLQKMERLLGHGFGIGEDTLSMHVEKAIESNVKTYGFTITELDETDINLTELISRSVNREPPFEESDHEKGFRDAIIAHNFFQLHKNSPATPNICRLALVSEDKRLREYVAEITKDSKNVRILSSLDELESLINTLVSSIPEDFAAVLAEKASKLFFEKDNLKTFYYKQEIRNLISEQYSEELKTPAIEGTSKSGKTWWISDPVFIKKDKSRIHWTSSVQPEFELYHYESTDVPEPLNALASQGLQKESSTKGIIAGILGGNNKKVIDQTGRDYFEVHWSTNLSRAQNLTAPKLEKISYIGNDLSE